MNKKFQVELRSRSWQQQMIDAAARQGKLYGLGWCVEVRAGLGHVGAVQYPVGYVPYIPAGPDQAVARDMAHLLLEILRSARYPGLRFEIALASLLDSSASPVWYEWGDQVFVDKVCEDCGRVFQVDSTLVVAGVWIGDCCVSGWSTFREAVQDDSQM